MENLEYKVSIITPCYNNEEHIAQTIESVLKQTHSNFELIIIDDCSTDNTTNVIKQFNDERIVLIINKENSGAAFSRNEGIKRATGDYIAFLDGDDLWMETKLEEQLKFMIDNKYDFSCTEYIEIDENNNELGAKLTGPDVITHKKYLCVDYSGCLTVMYRRDLFPDLQIPNTIKKRNDYALWIRLSERSNCYFLKKVLAKYRRRISSTSSGRKAKLLKYHRQVFVEVCGFSKLRAFVQSYINALWYIHKKIHYTKKYSLKNKQ